MKIVHLLGYSGSGKTTTISMLTRELSKAGKTVGTLKHVHEHDFAIDQKGKDSKIYRESGASTVVVVSSIEFVVIKDRVRQLENAIDEAIQVFEKEKTDYLFIEGFNSISKKKHHFKQILCVRDKKELQRLLKLHEDVDCVIWNSNKKSRLRIHLYAGLPVLFLPRDKAALIRLIS